MIVQFADPTLRGIAAPIPAAVETLAGTRLPVASPTSGGRHILQLPDTIDDASARKLVRDIKGLTSFTAAEIDTHFYPAYLPNDPELPQQWYLSEPAGGINATLAWDTTRGDASSIVAVLDTGITTHPDLAGKILPGYDFISDSNVANDGGGRDTDPADPGDWITLAESLDNSGAFFGCTVSNSSWHGTKIAGQVAALTDNSVGIAGIDHAAMVLPVRVLGKCGGSTSDIADAIRWAAGVDDPALPSVNPNPAHVINLSLGAIAACSNAMQAAINDAIDAGAVVVASAGNDAVDAGNSSPANCDGVLTVAASSRGGGRATYSNFGSVVNVAAPGGNNNGASGIFLTSNDGFTAPGNAGYTSVAGTSFAAPMASAVAALLRSVNTRLGVVDIKRLITTSARTFPTGTSDGAGDCTLQTCGAGLLDASNAVIAAANGALGGSGNGVVHMTVASACVTEEDGSITLDVTRDNGSGQISVQVITQNVSAEAGIDYTAFDDVVSWADGDLQNKSITIPVKADTIVEASEFFSVRLLNASLGVSIGEPDHTYVTLVSSNGNTPRSCNSNNIVNGTPSSGSGGGGAAPGLLCLTGLLLLYRRRKPPVLAHNGP